MSHDLLSNGGVHISRRLMLSGGLSATAVAAIHRLGAHGHAAPNDVEAFLRRWSDAAAELVAQDEPNEAAHLHRLCAGLAELDPTAFPKRMRTTFDGDGMQSGPVRVAMPFLVIEFELAPGAIIPAHNHVGFAFVSMGVSGEVAVRHFELEGPAPAPDELGVDFSIRESQSRVLSAGRTSALSRGRDNIHWFQAGDQGAKFLDFGIKFPAPGPGPKITSVLELEDEPVDPKRRVHTARWLGNIYAKKSR